MPSVNSSSAYIPAGNHRAFAHVVSPRGGVFAILSCPGVWALAYSEATPEHLKHFSFRKMDNFIGKYEAFVKDWLVHQGLEKLVNVLKV